MQHTVTIASPHCRAGTYQSAAHNTETRRHGLGFAMNDIEKKVYGAISKGLTFTERIQRMEYDTGITYTMGVTPVSLTEREMRVRKEL